MWDLWYLWTLFIPIICCDFLASEFPTPSFWLLPGHSALCPWETPPKNTRKTQRVHYVLRGQQSSGKKKGVKQMCQPHLSSPPGAQGYCLGHNKKDTLETGTTQPLIIDFSISLVNLPGLPTILKIYGRESKPEIHSGVPSGKLTVRPWKSSISCGNSSSNPVSGNVYVNLLECNNM